MIFPFTLSLNLPPAPHTHTISVAYETGNGWCLGLTSHLLCVVHFCSLLLGPLLWASSALSEIQGDCGPKQTILPKT